MTAKKQSVANQKGFWTPTRLAGTILVLALVAAFGASSCNSTDESAKKVTTPTITTNPARPATEPLATLPPTVLDAELRSVSGDPIKLADYGGKVMVVNLWATWCGPCRSEIPELVKLYQEFHSQGLEIIGLSTENPDASAEGVKKFVSNFNMNYRVGWATPEVAVTLMQERNAIPQSFVISRDGRVLTRFVGFNAIETPVKLRKAVAEALNSKSKT